MKGPRPPALAAPLTLPVPRSSRRRGGLMGCRQTLDPEQTLEGNFSRNSEAPCLAENRHSGSLSCQASLPRSPLPRDAPTSQLQLAWGARSALEAKRPRLRGGPGRWAGTHRGGFIGSGASGAKPGGPARYPPAETSQQMEVPGQAGKWTLGTGGLGVLVSSARLHPGLEHRGAWP